MVHVKVVLLCKGRGGDAASYQPHRDESQWWNRRDALVRCVSAFLHGPSSAYCTSRELVLVHDEDWARMHVTKGDATPSEFNVISAWRDTAQHATSAPSAVACKLVQSALPIAGADTVAAMESKREVLEHLQKHCDMDFLRGHRLNSKPDVVLRKTNKQALLRVWDEWTATHGTTAASKKDVVKAIFHEMLQPCDASIKRVIAATLHESSDAELPCFNTDLVPADDPSLQIVLFLGAVRDMTPTENNILQQLCTTQNIALTGVRLGAVPEFTSKILSVIAYHQARGVLGPALERACAAETESPAAKRQKTTSTSDVTSVPAHMHVVAAVPMASSGVTTDLASRSQALWAMVRLLVVTLWRSRIASSGAVPLTTALTFIFEDAVALTLKQDELVTALAEQHQAAPSEYQILRALCQYLTAATPDADFASMASRLVEASTIAIDVSAAAGERGLYEAFYTTGAAGGADDTTRLLVLVPLAPALAGHDAVVAACARASVPLVSQSLLPSREMAPAYDAEAAAVTMLQHLVYQQRLGSALASLAPKKPKKEKKAKKEKKTEKDKKAKKTKKEAIDTTSAKP
ncbi:hypothetical protein, variant [Saprolegnia diclina VS20]|uniref:Uncharacterized protein n=1 Tax=Saprolegnia diclina (strain VS20) TaxID=1156394 RepID=T0QWX4_SAPDV|nr:hypothetical protein SDRG_03397 [Saprolegnia diclina VS20]XP_008607253.1 hypothetical protein, variant [Saprolegnia diclina VS20]EQC39191.1 hypothetical protein SDRG_03397 [Saprolegnia diclina VS20]EQC39192.1 hypothetical protein, variant [Saprolegnia diclina VS20]|eukprot:XP_008607252.1 hypothetical protein SDRG_03397 [Saprolegnia diclina VS20]